LNFCSIACEVFGRDGKAADVVPMEELCRLLAVCTGPSFLVSARGKNGRQHQTDEASHKYRRSVLFEAIAVLGSVGKAIPSNCPSHILQVWLFSSCGPSFVDRFLAYLVFLRTAFFAADSRGHLYSAVVIQRLARRLLCNVLSCQVRIHTACSSSADSTSLSSKRAHTTLAGSHSRLGLSRLQPLQGKY
jgi:hypothetical protein